MMVYYQKGFAFLISIKKFKYSIYLSSILFISFISGERMAFATFGSIFLFRKSIFLSIIIGVFLIFMHLIMILNN